MPKGKKAAEDGPPCDRCGTPSAVRGIVEVHYYCRVCRREWRPAPVRACVECGAEYQRKGGQLTCGIECALARRSRMARESLERKKGGGEMAEAPPPDARFVGNQIQPWPAVVWGRPCGKCGARCWKVTTDDEASCVQCGLVLYRRDCEAVGK